MDRSTVHRSTPSRSNGRARRSWRAPRFSRTSRWSVSPCCKKHLLRIEITEGGRVSAEPLESA